tara:strand:+ start:7538 stop:8233 length:696 start_codon:yes stop_codon:yes gene_type:complete
MLIEKSQKITFIHGWLFGPYIWSGVTEYFSAIKKHKLISLAGYGSKTTINNKEIVDNILKSAIPDDIILSYSYSAALILLSNNLVPCKGTVILINPFFKPKENSIYEFYKDIKTDFQKNIKKFIYDCVKKRNEQSKSDYQSLLRLFEKNYIPPVESLCLDLQYLEKINFPNKSTAPLQNLHIIQSSSDEVNNTDIFNLLENNRFNTYRLSNSSHFPFFEFDKIYEIIKNIK